jgi:two-component system phosphate regulon sensor histidine kinase PhoR
MFKNLTPRQISIYSALVIGVIISLVLVLINVTGLNQIWLGQIGLIVAIVLCSYVVNLFFLKKYIFRKIKLIYKTIHSLKLDPRKKQKSIDGDDQIIDDVEKDVASWALDRQKEIDQLKTLENYRREFLGNVSHELKTPIFNIQGYIHTLIDGGIDDPAVNLKYLDRSAKNVERLITIVDDLETISKLESGNLVLDIRKFDIKSLVDEVFETHELSAQKRNIQLVYKEGASQNFEVKADKDYIRQVLDNLILNSIKYGRNMGFTKVSFYDMDKYILVEIADNGLGIGQEHLKHVFDRFYRVDKSRSRDAGGSGLGLSIVKHIVEAHNQTINVRSSKDLGSTFGFTLAKA